MPEIFKTIAAWLTTSGVKILGIVIAFVILSQMSKWIVKWIERFVPENDSLQAFEAKKRMGLYFSWIILHRSLL